MIPTLSQLRQISDFQKTKAQTEHIHTMFHNKPDMATVINNSPCQFLWAAIVSKGVLESMTYKTHHKI